MKRMTENPIGYYTIKEFDITNIIDTGDGVTFRYIPSTEFIEVLKEFKDVLIADWEVIFPPMAVAYHTKLSILYPANIEDLPTTTSEDEVGYTYTSSKVRDKNIMPTFYKEGPLYKIKFNQ